MRNNSYCRRRIKGITKLMFCAGGGTTQDACKGDSGGPFALWRYVVPLDRGVVLKKRCGNAVSARGVPTPCQKEVWERRAKYKKCGNAVRTRSHAKKGVRKPFSRVPTPLHPCLQTVLVWFSQIYQRGV